MGRVIFHGAKKKLGVEPGNEASMYMYIDVQCHVSTNFIAYGQLHFTILVCIQHPLASCIRHPACVNTGTSDGSVI